MVGGRLKFRMFAGPFCTVLISRRIMLLNCVFRATFLAPGDPLSRIITPAQPPPLTAITRTVISPLPHNCCEVKCSTSEEDVENPFAETVKDPLNEQALYPAAPLAFPTSALFQPTGNAVPSCTVICAVQVAVLPLASWTVTVTGMVWLSWAQLTIAGEIFVTVSTPEQLSEEAVALNTSAGWSV